MTMLQELFDAKKISEAIAHIRTASEEDLLAKIESLAVRLRGDALEQFVRELFENNPTVSPAIFEAFLKKKIILPNFIFKDKEPLLFYVLRQGSVEYLSILLNNGADYHVVANNRYALYLAVELGDVEKIKLLLKQKHSPNLLVLQCAGQDLVDKVLDVESPVAQALREYGYGDFFKKRLDGRAAILEQEKKVLQSPSSTVPISGLSPGSEEKGCPFTPKQIDFVKQVIDDHKKMYEAVKCRKATFDQRYDALVDLFYKKTETVDVYVQKTIDSMPEQNRKLFIESTLLLWSSFNAEQLELLFEKLEQLLKNKPRPEKTAWSKAIKQYNKKVAAWFEKQKDDYKKLCKRMQGKVVLHDTRTGKEMVLAEKDKQAILSGGPPPASPKETIFSEMPFSFKEGTLLSNLLSILKGSNLTHHLFMWMYPDLERGFISHETQEMAENFFAFKRSWNKSLLDNFITPEEFVAALRWRRIKEKIIPHMLVSVFGEPGDNENQAYVTRCTGSIPPRTPSAHSTPLHTPVSSQPATPQRPDFWLEQNGARRDTDLSDDGSDFELPPKIPRQAHYDEILHLSDDEVKLDISDGNRRPSNGFG